ncbi:MAG TPA: Gfo/Idh/MocA family oxidoreductase [Tepidisphaeraceae bacterium]|jgi:predicted dehydrogenase
MSRITRRRFLSTTAATGAAMILASTSRRALGANDDLRVAVVGCGGRGSSHIGAFSKIEGARLVAVCDADESHLNKAVQQGEKAQKGQKVKPYKDVRKLLEDKEIDAIATATPNHWHSLVTVWACQAGKDVYVEKPISHEIWEGRKCIEAMKKYNRVVQHGTQRRSDHLWYEAFDFIRQGNLGPVQWVKGFCYKPRPSIGKVPAPTPIPAGVDYDLWCGPAPMDPLMRKNLHYDWHWVWPTGNGDIGNQGVHEMDLSRWAVGNNSLPERVLGIGGRFIVDDDATTPNTLIVYYDYKPVPFIFEVRGLPSHGGDPNKAPMDAYGKIIRIGNWVQCEGGYFAAGEGGGWAYDKDGKKIRQFKQQLGGQGHQQTFVKACKSRDPKDNPCNAEVAHFSAACCHLGNISYRTGAEKSAAEITESIKSNSQMAEAFDRMKDHLGKNGFNLDKDKITLGANLTIDPGAERFTGDHAEAANKLLKRDYRKPYEIPESV